MDGVPRAEQAGADAGEGQGTSQALPTTGVS